MSDKTTVKAKKRSLKMVEDSPLTSRGKISILAYPELMKEWDWDANNAIGLVPQEVSYGIRTKANWKCQECSQLWLGEVKNRVSGAGAGCPRRRLHNNNTFADKNHELLKEFHPTKNKQDKGILYDCTPSSTRKFWWVCSVNYEHHWEASLGDRNKGTGCPYCAGIKVHPTNSFAFLHSELAKEWHPTLNVGKRAEDIVAHHGQQVWWLCKKNSQHKWETHTSDRINGSGCPYCSGRYPSPDNNLAFCFPKIATQLHPSKNGDLKAFDLTPKSSKNVWWLCPNEHSWQCVVSARTDKGRSCKECNLESAQKNAEKKLKIKKEKELKKKKLELERKQALQKKEHRIRRKQKQLKISRPNQRKANKNITVSSDKATTPTPFISLLEHSPHLILEWDQKLNNDVLLSELAYGSKKKYRWRCSLYPDHIWKAAPIDRTRRGKSECPYCKSLSIVRPDIAKFWHPVKNGTLTPLEVTPHSRKVVKWQCIDNPTHEWEKAVNLQTLAGKCSMCTGWPLEKYQLLLKDNRDIMSMSLPERYHILGSLGLLNSYNKGKVMIQGILMNLVTEQDVSSFIDDKDYAAKILKDLLNNPSLRNKFNRLYIPKKARIATLIRDNYTCQLCNKKDKPRHIDHFIPWVLGGAHHIDNFWVLCDTCNLSKGMRIPNSDMVTAWINSGRKLPKEYFALVKQQLII